MKKEQIPNILTIGRIPLYTYFYLYFNSRKFDRESYGSSYILLLPVLQTI